MTNAEPLVGGNYNKRIARRPQTEAVQPDRETVGRRMRMLVSSRIESAAQPSPCIADHLHVSATERELLAAEQVAMARPEPLRDYDQISMQAGDLLRQVKLMQPLLEGKRVAFMGDNDGASLLLGLLGVQGAAMPARMTLLDFDQRILAAATALAQDAGFGDRFETRAYNAFDPVPVDLAGRFDVFYTNPPYGKGNSGASGRLFVTRGIELCHRQGGACGCIILPDDDERAWTVDAMLATQSFLTEHGWTVREKLNQLHHYDLPKDPGLTSSTLWVRDALKGKGALNMPYTGKRVPAEEIANFYGRKVPPPYPRYIRENEERDYDWAEEESTNA